LDPKAVSGNQFKVNDLYHTATDKLWLTILKYTTTEKASFSKIKHFFTDKESKHSLLEN
jgi:hypothetical protein